jgi:hypothetical protein
MTIKSSGPLNLTEIQTEFGGENPISLNEYYGVASGIPTSGAISFNDFYGKTFIVVEKITTTGTWSPKLNVAKFIHIFVVGAGGSGGMGWPEGGGGFLGLSEGVAGASGGGAGGVAYSRITGTTTGSATVTIGVGGDGVGVTADRSAINGNAGTASSFVGLNLNMTAAGGGAGQGRQKLDGGTTTIGSAAAPIPGGSGGTASGGNQSNLTGGSGGGFYVSGRDVLTSAAGGGAPRFLSSNSGTASVSATSTTTAGIKVSDYTAYPTIAAYADGRSQSFLGSTITDFDASNGNRTGNSGSPTYGAGSGGVATTSAKKSGRGGNGVIIIVYEV